MEAIELKHILSKYEITEYRMFEKLVDYEDFKCKETDKYIFLKSWNSHYKNIIVSIHYLNNEDCLTETFLGHDKKAIVDSALRALVKYPLVLKNIQNSSILISQTCGTTSDLDIFTDINFNSLDEYFNFYNNIIVDSKHKYRQVINNKLVELNEI